MTANKSFHVGDSIVIEWLPSVDDEVVEPYAQALTIETPITSIVWDPDADDGVGANIITGGTLTEYSSTQGNIYLLDDVHYGIVFVPDEIGWHRFIIAGWESAGVKLFSRMGTFYVQDATLRPAP